MGAPVLPTRVYRFGLFEVDPKGGELLRKGAPVKVHEQPLRVLCLLLERPGEVVTREELRQSLWPEGTYVEFDGSLNAALKKLRFALGDNADNPIFIETVPRRGYRFIAPVECESEAGVAADQPSPPDAASLPASDDSTVAMRPRFWLWSAVAVVAIILLLTGWRYARRNRATAAPPRVVIAVLPFSNQGAGPDFDYLRYAIANDLVTDLTYTEAITVRPFASTSRYGSSAADPAAVGKELRVTHVVAGGFLLDQQNLRVNLELVDVEQNQPIWREEVTVPPQDMVALHDKLAARAAQGLLPAVKVVGASLHELPAPKNEQALDLFLHSLTISYDPEPNLLAIQKLEESVSLDGGYAPAWGELGERYYIDYHYGNGGEAAVAKALAAYKHRSDLDPNSPVVSTAIRAEQGDLNGAYDQASNFLRRHPDVATGHHQMSYVLRSAGLLDESVKHCDAALALDPGYSGFRSCAVPRILQGDYTHAQPFIQLDRRSGFGATLRLTIDLRTGNLAAALSESDAASQGGFPFVGLAKMCLNHAPASELRKAAAALEVDPRSAHDPEMLYFNASTLSFCGQGDAALRQLRKAVKGNYCSYPALDNDPLFDPIRQRSEFAELRQAAIQCQQDFLAHRRQSDEH